MNSGNKNIPSKELSSHSEEEEGSLESSEDRSSSNTNSPTRTPSSSSNFQLSESSLHKKPRLDTQRENVSSTLPPFYNLQSSDMNIPSSSSQPFSNLPSQTNFQNMPQQDNLNTININLTSRQEVPSSELSSMNSPLAPKPSQRQNVVGEDFRGHPPSASLLERQGLHTQIAPLSFGYHQHYPGQLHVNVQPLPNLSLPYPLPSFSPQTQTYYSPNPQYHLPIQYSMQQQPTQRSATDSISNPTQPATNQKEYQISNLDPKPTSISQHSQTSSTDQVTSQPATSSIANLSSSQQPSSSSSTSASSISMGAVPSSSRETSFQTAQGVETPQSVYLQSPYSSQGRTQSSHLPPTVRSSNDEPYYNWPPQLPPVSLGRPAPTPMYGHVAYHGVPMYPSYMGQVAYDASGMPMHALPGVWQVPPPSAPQSIPSGVPTTGSASNFSQRQSGSWQTPYSPHKRPAVEGPRSVNLVPTQQHRFELQMQPFSNQRKSYKSEKRYILPNPITLCLKKKKPSDNNNNANTTSESSDDVVSGFVAVDLVDGLGHTIANKDEIFASIDGTFSQTLSAEGVAQFSLKVLANSGPDKYRLLFRVVYTTRDGVTYEEQIPSQAFSVKSNKALKAKMAQEAQKENLPHILELSVSKGRPHKAVSVWIKGKGINNPQVMFGDRQATIKDWDEDLIRCTAPIRLDINQDTSVDVTVSNLTADGASTLEGRLQYTYKLKKNRPKPPSPQNQNPPVPAPGPPL